MRVDDERLAGLRRAWKRMQHALGQPRIFKRLCEQDPSGDGRLGVGLDDHGVAQRDRRCDRP